MIVRSGLQFLYRCLLFFAEKTKMWGFAFFVVVVGLWRLFSEDNKPKSFFSSYMLCLESSTRRVLNFRRTITFDSSKCWNDFWKRVCLIKIFCCFESWFDFYCICEAMLRPGTDAFLTRSFNSGRHNYNALSFSKSVTRHWNSGFLLENSFRLVPEHICTQKSGLL